MHMCSEEKNKVVVRFLGQAGFKITSQDLSIVIDPYFSDSVDRQCSSDGVVWKRNYTIPYEKKTEYLSGIDYVLLSHDHLDHTDPETLIMIRDLSPKAAFAASAWFAPRLAKIGIPENRIISLKSGKVCTLAGESGADALILPVPAAHEELHPCEPGGFMELGFIVELCGRRIYHGGDTCVYDGHADIIRNVNLAILPVNGRDKKRASMNVVGNMNAREAAKLACDSGVGAVIPCHWDLYDNNGETIENIIAAFEQYPDVKYKILKFGECIVL